MEEAYPRASAGALKTITLRHNKLSNQFSNWLNNKLHIESIQEQNRINIRFEYDEKSVRAELKICYGLGTRRSIREVLGQILEYNYYPTLLACEGCVPDPVEQ
jgi:hypothetical protein